MSSMLGSLLCCVAVAIPLVAALAAVVWFVQRRTPVPPPPPRQLTSEEVIHAELALTFALMIKQVEAPALPALDAADAAILARAHVELTAGRFDAAIKAADAALGTASPALRASLLQLQGDAHLRRGDAEAAFTAYRALADLYPDNRTLLGSVAEALAKQARMLDLLALAAAWEKLGGTPEGRSRYNDLKRALEAVTYA